MISTNIDLTENHDFSNFDDLFAPDLHVGEILRGVSPTLEEHEKYIEKVKKFGKKYHTDESIYAFKPIGELKVNRINETCGVCGKQILPWSETFTLCSKCNRNAKRLPPWKYLNPMPIDRIIFTNEVFGLR